MALRFPNCTGETGTLADGVITLNNTALSSMRTFAAAASANKLAEADTIGLCVRHATNPSIWFVATANYAAGTLSLIEIEDGAGVIPNSATVDVFATLTDAMLSTAGMSLTTGPAEYQMGPEWWDEDTAPAGGLSAATWIEAEGHYETDGGFTLIPVTTGPNANWGIGFNPREISAEVYLPVDSYPYDNNVKLIANNYTASGSTPSVRDAGTWVTLTITIDQGLSGATDMVNLILSEMTTGAEPGLLRNIRVVGA